MTRVLLWDLGTERDEHNEPLGIEMLAGALREKVPESETELRWENACSDSLCLDLGGYDIVGLSAKLGTLPHLNRIVHAVRRLPHRPLVVVGDVLPTFAYRGILAEYPEVVCVLGEGETAFQSIVRSTLEGDARNPRSLQQIPNLAFVSNDSIIQTTRLQEDTSTLPAPARHFITWTIEHRGILRVEGSRGCDWSACQFCCVAAKYGGGGWRPFPIDAILAQLTEISSLGGVAPYFSDEDFFGGDHQRAIDLAEAIIDAKSQGAINPEMNFFISARANDLVGPDAHKALIAMRQAGLREVFVGIEAGSSVQLCRYGKHATPDLNKSALAALRQLRLHIDIGYILFEPEMSLDELKVNAKYLYELELAEHDARSIKDMRVQPLTPLADKYLRQGLVSGPLDINSLRYPVRYHDDRVAWILERFTEYEGEAMKEVYRIQASSRGEVKSVLYRAQSKALLGQVRKIDLEQLCALIAFSDGEIDKADLHRAADDHRRRRASVLASFRTEQVPCSPSNEAFVFA